jgi:threonine dehydrogenase-like Zn-dependent dehydrogenase
MPHDDAGRRMGHEFIGVPERDKELLPDVLEGRIEPGRVFDRTGSIEDVSDGYRAMNDREVLKFQITP